MTRQLDPDAQNLLDVMSAIGLPPLHTLSVKAARERMRASLIPKGDPLPIRRVTDVLIPSACGTLPLRLYRPTEGNLPVVLFFHGGGWTVNDVDTHDELCRRVAKRSGSLLASLDYRRAPEHKHPAALQDAYLGYRWLLDNADNIGCDSKCPAVVGESSGGTIAAALSLLLRDTGAPMPTFQIMAYPVMDQLDSWPSYAERGSGYALDRDTLRWFFANYLPATFNTADPYLFPLAAPDLSRLPPALIMTAEFDPVRDEGLAYADRLALAGVPVAHLHADDQMHGFLLQGRAVAKARDLVDRLADALISRSQPE
jgi:acetyl esterase